MSRWTWERFTLPRFAELQAARGRASGKARRAAGYTQVLIARVIGVHRNTVRNVLEQNAQ